MQAIEVANGVEVEMSELIKRLSKMEIGSLEKLAVKLNKVVAKRKEPTKAEREAKLVKEIKQKIPKELYEYRDTLVAKLHDGTITGKEKEDLDFTINYMDELNSKRIILMSELAQLRNVDIDIVAAEFRKNIL